MSRFFVVLLLGVVLPTTLLGLSKEQAIQLASAGKVDLRILQVKFANTQDAAFNDGGFAVGGKRWQLPTTTAYKVGATFTRGKEVYRKERAAMATADTSVGELPHLENYFYFTFKNPLAKEDALKLLKAVQNQPGVEIAYFEPLFEDAVFHAPNAAEEGAVEKTPDFESKQFHLDVAPRGVDARYFWGFPGGKGEGVKVVDVETGWNFDHEDMNKVFYKSDVFNATSTDHGTAVWGEIAGKNDGVGITGIASEVKFGTSGAGFKGDWDDWKQKSLPRAVDLATQQLSSQDVMIIEQHGPGPKGDFVAVEFFPAVYDALVTATKKGIIVVAAAGNGYANLDADHYEGAFDLKKRDSGCILVGAAGSPLSGKHLNRLGFSNYGSRIDVFGYGEDVVTAGYGDLQNGGKDKMYTKQFSGTSSATPIVTGVVASLLGIAKKKGVTLTYKDIRAAFRETGSEQKGNTKERIGNLPNAKELYDFLFDNKKN